jgi:hypothetical protein
VRLPAPGEQRFAYANINYVLAGMIIEKVTGHRLLANEGFRQNTGHAQRMNVVRSALQGGRIARDCRWCLVSGAAPSDQQSADDAEGEFSLHSLRPQFFRAPLDEFAKICQRPL